MTSQRLFFCLSLGLCLLCAPPASPALAQPMMLDPSQMSGIPRPDPQVPAGTITVRLIRGQLTNRLPGVEVELVETATQEKRSEKTDAEGRATFAGMKQGTYEARAVVDSEALASQPIELPDSPGIRVMLVFSQSAADQQKELGTADGKARVDASLPAGTLLLKVVGEGSAPMADLPVLVNHAVRATEKVDALPQQKTGPDGTVHFDGLLSGAGDGYLVSVVRDGVPYRSKPFHLVPGSGSLLVMEVKKVSTDLSRLTIGTNSHIVVELADEMVQVLENLFLHNPLDQAIQPPPAGLRLPLPEGALSAQTVPGSSPSLSIDVSHADRPPELVWKGPVPPGDTPISVGFLLPQKGTLTVHQATPLAFDAVRVFVMKTAEVKLEGPGFETEDRKFNGHDLIVATSPPPKAGSVLEFTLSGLPHETPVLRYLAGCVAVAVAVAFGLLSRRRSDEGAALRRARLERRRQELLDQILALDRDRDRDPGGGASSQRKKKAPSRPDLVAELESIYRELDAPEES